MVEAAIVPVREVQTGELPADEAQFEPVHSEIDVYRLSPDLRPWEIFHDILGDRTGLRTHTHGTSSVNSGTQVETDAQLEVWAHNRDPADVAAVGKHHRRIGRNDGEITVDTCCSQLLDLPLGLLEVAAKRCQGLALCCRTTPLVPLAFRLE